MADYKEKRASPLTQYSFAEVSINLSAWRDLLREELETLIYIKNCLSLREDSSVQGDQSQHHKIKALIPKLEALCLKEIDCINDLLTSINESRYVENSESFYCKVESIRDNYNKIIVNIQKMISSVPLLDELRLKYINSFLPKEKDIRTICQREESRQPSRTAPTQAMKLNAVQCNKDTVNSNSGQKAVKDEWIDCVNADINELNRIKLAKTYSEKDSISMKAFNKVEENKSNSYSRHNSKNKMKPALNRPITPILNTTTKKQLNTTTSQLNSSNKQCSRQNLLEKEAMSVLAEEIRHIKSYYEELNQTVHEHCLISPQKKEFEQMKKDNIKLIADVSILKEDMADLMRSYQQLSTAVTALQTENDNLKQQNRSLVAYISNTNDSEHQKRFEQCFNSNDLMLSNSLQDSRYNKTSEAISDLSAFNSQVKGAHVNQSRGRNSGTQGFMNENATNLYELTKMNQTITNNSKNTTPNQRSKQRRFLINKD